LPSLKEEFYRLPEIGGIWTPDVLVFRQSVDQSDAELPRSERFYVDVVTAAMIRFPDVVENGVSSRNFEAGIFSANRLENRATDEVTKIEKAYASQKDRDLALAKMRAVLRMLTVHKTERVVLGAWGCGAYGNPVNEIVAAWQRALLGTRGKSSNCKAQPIDLGILKEVVFAIKDLRMAQDFAAAWGNDMEIEEMQKSTTGNEDDLQKSHVKELQRKIEALGLQCSEAKTPMLKQGLEGTLHVLRRELAKVDQEATEEETDIDD
jgi:hypothetical protein